MGSDRTLTHDVATAEEIQFHLRRSADRLGERLRAKGYLASGVRVRLKNHSFKRFSRQVVLPKPTDNANVLFEVGALLLEQFGDDGPYRLVGMAVYDLHSADSPEQYGLLFDEEITRQTSSKLQRVVDSITEKFGSGSVTRGGNIGRSHTVSGTTPNLDFIDE